jgi:hypothetical protein
MFATRKSFRTVAAADLPAARSLLMDHQRSILQPTESNKLFCGWTSYSHTDDLDPLACIARQDKGGSVALKLVDGPAATTPAAGMPLKALIPKLFLLQWTGHRRLRG